MNICIRDESPAGEILHSLDLYVAQSRISVKELIAARVRSEVASYNENRERRWRGLVQPEATEQFLNNTTAKRTAEVDAEKQVYVAWEAFQRNGFFVLVDDKQVSHLEEIVELHAGSTLSFIRLTPLVGG